MQPQIYLFFKGNCEAAMRFYAELFGGEVAGIFLNGDASPDARMPGGDDMVMNMAITVGGATMMGSDNSDEMYDRPQGFYVNLPASSAEEAQRWFDALKEDGEVAMPLDETFWAERFGMVRDRFGTPWMVNYEGAKGEGQPV
ncbi:MAG: VOC family protein [Euryhalocaulis sp.]|uniref:VOC family protein n=1 Tax=Euryhalocaulis sp. TaxID=2744307 RepID=UPI0017A95617|nr:VOC family protein [Euryhalocaulis sp.]MBA4800281.1 VOC family protein [Euryhalocaulis sp.]